MTTTKNNIPPAGYKDSAVGIIPQDWKVRQFKNCFTVGHGRDYKHLPNGNIPVYGSGGIICYVGSHLHDGETVCIGRKGTINKPFYYNGSIWTVDTLFYTHSFRNILPRYVGYLFDNIDWMRYNEATGVPSLTAKTISNIKLAMPPMGEQRKIAEILGVWDEAIEKQNLLIEKLELRKRGLMQRLLTGKTRLPGFTEPWQKEICKRVTLRNEENCQNVMTISAQRGFVSQTDFFNKSVASSTLDNYYLVHKDEFCYNKSYSNGYPMGAIKRLKETEKAVVTTLYICFSIADCKRLDINFFEQYCEFGGLNRGLTKVANEGGRAHGLLNVTPSDFFGLQLLLPSLSEQKAIAEVLNTADKEIAIHRKKLNALRLQKHGLMQQLLTGKIRVKI